MSLRIFLTRATLAALVCAVICGMAMPSSAADTATGRALRDFGLLFNEDGDIVLTVGDPEPTVAATGLRRALDSLKTTRVKTLVYQVGCGSDVLHYPTNVGSRWGWRQTQKEQTKPWDQYMAKMRPAAAEGLDSVRIGAEWCKENDVYFVPSYRMNDAHYCSDPENNPLTGKFWVDNHERLELKESPVPEVPNYQHLLDFSKPEVRAYRLAIIIEVIERYQDVMEGIQLDFMRNPVLFPKGTAKQNAPLLTEMIQQVRSRLDVLEKKNGRTYALMVRVPPTLKHCHNMGMDVDEWLKQRLVDVVTPSPAMTLAHDMVLKEWLALASVGGAKVYPGILERTQFTWPFSFSPTEQSYGGVVDRNASPSLFRGAAMNYTAMRASGVEAYNFNLPLSPAHQQAMAALVDPTAGERIYTITPHYWIDTNDLFEPVKQIPVTLESGRPVRLSLFVGENLAGSQQPLRCALRLGLNTPRKPDEFQRVEVVLNGKTLHTGPLQSHYTTVTGKASASPKQHPPLVTGYLQLLIADLRIVRPGWNELVFHVVPKQGNARCILSEVTLAVEATPR